MKAQVREAVLRGTMQAERLHANLGTRDRLERDGVGVDVFEAVSQMGLPLLFRPLDGLIGAYLRDPQPGVLVTTRRPLAVQRFTAAHELGHYILEHRPSLDDESILRRSPFAARASYDRQEIEADAFAASFLIPRWLVAHHARRQGWGAADFATPHVVYQLSLRIGASFEATWRTLLGYRYLAADTARRFRDVSVRDLKKELLRDYRPPDYRRDVWLLTERDTGTSIVGSRNDFLVLKLGERSGSGYLWNADDLESGGFAVLRDMREEIDTEGVGNPTFRRIIVALREARRGTVSLDERRPWRPAEPLNSLRLNYDLTGPEEPGYSRATRRRLLEAA